MTKAALLPHLMIVLVVLAALAAASLPALRYVAPQESKVVEVAGARTLELEGGVIRYDREGAEGEDAVVLLHGFNGQLSAWNALWPRLVALPARARLDLPGFGGSRWNADSYSLEEQARRVLAFMDAVKIPRATLAGASMGGSLAAWITARHPERVKALVLMAPSGYPGSLRFPGLFRHLLGPGFFNSAAAWLADTSAYRTLFPDSSALQALTVTASYGEPWAAALSRIRAPTVVLWSRGDATVPFEYAGKVTGAIAGARLVALPADVGHDIPNNAAAAVADAIMSLHAGGPNG